MLDKITDLLKKKNLLVKILVPVTFIVTMLETFIYYKDKYGNFYTILLGLINGVRIFNFNTTMKIADVLDRLNEDPNPVEILIHNLFIVFYVIAPILLVTVIYIAANYFLNNLLNNWFGLTWAKKKNLIVLFGYNNNSKEMLYNFFENSSQNSSDYSISTPKNSKVILYYSKDMSDLDKRWLIGKNVFLCSYNSHDLVSNKDILKPIFKHIKQREKINLILFENDENLNFANYLNINSYLKNLDNLDRIKVNISINYETPNIESLIYDYYNDRCDTSGVAYNLSAFSVPMLRCQKTLETVPIFDDEDYKKDNKDVHLLIVGFGRFGSRFLRRAINQCVVDAENKIVVDLVDMNNKDSLWYFKNINQAYYHEKDIEKDVEKEDDLIGWIEPDSDIADGTLRIRFLKMDIRDSSFITKLKNIDNYDYIAICLDSANISLECMKNFEEYYDRKDKDKKDNKNKKPKIVIRLDSEYDLKQLENKDKQIYIMPSVKDAVSIESVQHEDWSKISAQYHKKEEISKSFVKQYNTRKDFFDEARSYRILHYEIKNKIISYGKYYDYKSDLEKLLHITAGEMFNDPLEALNDYDKNEFAEDIKNYPNLKQLGAIEHRRWAYHKIFNGFTRGKERNDLKKTVKHLVTYDKLLNDDELKSSAKYDYKDWVEIIMKDNKGEKK